MIKPKLFPCMAHACGHASMRTRRDTRKAEGPPQASWSIALQDARPPIPGCGLSQSRVLCIVTGLLHLGMKSSNSVLHVNIVLGIPDCKLHNQHDNFSKKQSKANIYIYMYIWGQSHAKAQSRPPFHTTRNR